MKKILSVLCALAMLLTMCSVASVGFASAEGEYVISTTQLAVGENACAMQNDAYTYTAFKFKPTEDGVYTFTVSDGVIGVVSGTHMWVQNTPTEENVNATSAQWECSSVGQGTIVAVKSDAASVTITVGREDLPPVEEVPKTVYENQATVVEYGYTGDTAALLRVDILDDIADEAVLGEDGYYHLNSANGPLLLANLADSQMSLVAADSYGQLTETQYDEEGNVTAKIDYTAAFAEYTAAITTGSKYYPLTVDLMTIFKNVGEYRGWYGANGWVGGELADAWMFACYYEAPADTRELYTFGDNYLAVGDNECVMYNTDYQYTVFAFCPEQDGVYTFSTADGVIGIVSQTDMWVQDDPSADNVNVTITQWECSSVGQGIVVAVKSAADTAVLTVERADRTPDIEIEWTIYENQAAVNDFEFTLPIEELLNVDVYDDVADEAVLGEDGYYHLNSADGPVLYVNLNDDRMSLVSANGYGQLRETQYDAEGNVMAKIDYSDAFGEYVAAIKDNSDFYPLTVDLMVMLQGVGMSAGWYGAEGYLGAELADAWMFACYYIPATEPNPNPDPETVRGDVNEDGSFSIQDALLTFQSLNGAVELNETQTANADINGDGEVTIQDALTMFQFLNGAIESM